MDWEPKHKFIFLKPEIYNFDPHLVGEEEAVGEAEAPWQLL